MAKAYRQANTRIATTVNARYYPTDDISDGYFLDGRFPGKREGRAADVTLDREDRGAVLAVYGRPQDEETAWQDSLQNLTAQVKAGNHEIDDELNLLAEASLEITGRQTLTTSGREPYFAGVMVQDGEAVAITLGDAGAYLYRSDFLHALTNDDFPLEAIDFNGNPVELGDAYAAGSAGTVRYSNIVSLEQNDVLIVCNRDVLAAVGQKEFMRLLYEAEDANEAAGLIMTAASAKSPGIPMQIGLSFIDYIMPLDKKTGLNLGRFATASLSQAELNANAQDAKTQQFNPEMLARGGAGMSGSGKPESPTRDYSANQTGDKPISGDTSGIYAKLPSTKPGSDTDRYSRMAASSFARGQGGGDVDYAEQGQDAVESNAVQEGYRAAQERYSAEQPFGRRRGAPAQTTDRAYSAHDLDDLGAYEDYDDYEDLDDRGRVKKIIVLVLLGAVILASIYVLIRLLVGGGDTPATQPSTVVTEAVTDTTVPAVITPSTEEPEPTETEETTEATETEASTAETTQAGSRTYIVQAGDSWWAIATRFYGRGSMELSRHIAVANGKTENDGISVGEELIIPPAPTE